MVVLSAVKSSPNGKAPIGGCPVPTGTVANGIRSSTEIRVTELLPKLLTAAVELSGLTATRTGTEPTGTLIVKVRAAASKTAT